jgi:hypothetical protein
MAKRPVGETDSPPEKTATTTDPTEQFRALLAVLDPPDEVVVTDAAGCSHRLRSAVSARAQIRIFREFERVKDLPVAEGLSGLDLAGGAGLAGALVALASDPDVLGSLARCFEIAHPEAVAAARVATTTAGLPVDEIVDAADLFPIEELVAGLLPLFGRLVQRSAGAMRALGGTMPTTSPT